jgi:hypothetical protein
VCRLEVIERQRGEQALHLSEDLLIVLAIVELAWEDLDLEGEFVLAVDNDIESAVTDLVAEVERTHQKIGVALIKRNYIAQKVGISMTKLNPRVFLESAYGQPIVALLEDMGLVALGHHLRWSDDDGRYL